MNEIEIYTIGTAVVIDGDISAVVRGVTIYSATWVKYCCVWWDERTRREEWLTADEIQFKNNSKMTVRLK
jgi:hypothetical protein